MVRTSGLGLLVLAAILLCAFTLPATAADILITEIMENPSGGADNEYIEIHNPTTAAIDLATYWITDGDEIDQITTWDSGGGVALAGMRTGTTIIGAGEYALILDKGYDGTTYAALPAGTLVLTVSDTDLGSGLTADDPITIVKNYNSPPQVTTVVTTYGTPNLGDLTNWGNLDDDGLDTIPSAALAQGLSMERRSLTLGDAATNWGTCAGVPSPGAVNTINGTGPSSAVKITEAGILPTTDQWVELSNTGTSAVKLAGWVLTDRDGNNFSFPDFTLAASSYVVVRFDATHTSADNTATVLYAGKTGVFSSTYDQVALYWSSQLNSQTIADFVAYRISSTYADGGDDDDAVTAGIWTDGVFADLGSMADNTSFGLKGADSNQPSDWSKLTISTPGAANPAPMTGGSLVINEVVFNSATGQEDWVEVKNISAAAVNLKGVAFYESSTSTPVKTITADTTLGAGKYLLLTFNTAKPDESDSTGDTSVDGIINIYTNTDTGLTGTSSQVFMTDPTSSIVDAVVWGNSTLSNSAILTYLQAAGAWGDETPAGADVNDVFSSDGVGTGQSIARDSNSTDTGRKSDWRIMPSPGPGTGTPAPFTAVVKINEVMFNAGTGKEDWVELFCVNDGKNGAGADLSGCGFFDDSIFKSLGQGTLLKTGEYLILNFDSSTADETTAGADGILTVQTDRSGLTGTDEQVVFYDPFGNMIDAVCWADQSGAWTSGEQEDVAAIINAGHWEGANESDSIPSNSVKTNDSVARDQNSTDTDNRSDWTIRSEATPGTANGAPPTVDKFIVTAPAYAISGQPFEMLITAYDVNGAVLENYSGTPDLTASAGVTVSPTEAAGFVSGVATVSTTLTGTVGTVTEITVSDNGRTSSTGSIELVSALPTPGLVINEVAFKNGGGGFEGDWVELWCKDDGRNGQGINLRGYYFDDMESTRDKILGNCVLKTGEYLLLHYKAAASDVDETSLVTGDRAVDVFTLDTGLTDTDEQVVLSNPAGVIIDAVVWVEGEISSTEVASIQTLANNGQWTIAGAAPAPADCVDSSTANVASGSSIARDGIGTDNNAKGDWTPSTVPTPGDSNANGPREDVVLRISEVAYKKGGGGISADWIELFCVDDRNNGGGSNVTGYILEDDSKIKTLSAGTTIRTGEFILLQFDTDKTDETEATDGIIRIYTTDSGLTDTDENLIVYNHLNVMVDAVVWNDGSGSIVDSEVADMQKIITAGQWTGVAGEADGVNGSDMEEGQSIARDRHFTDTNAKSDWRIATVASPGKVNALPGEAVRVILLPADTKTLVDVEATLTLEGRDIQDSLAVASDFYVNLYTNSSTALFSADGGFTWSSTVRVRLKNGSVPVKVKDPSPATITVTATSEDTFVNSGFATVTFQKVPDIVINEIMYNTDEAQGDSSEGEWVELYNRGTSTVDLSGWKVTISGTETTIPAGTTMAPDSYLVLASQLTDTNGNGVAFAYLYGDRNGTWDPALDGFAAIDAKDFALSDTSDTVSITSVPESITVTLTFDDGWGADGDGRSLEKKDPWVVDRNEMAVDQRNWCQSEPALSHGTPGKRNSVFAGTISALFMSHTAVTAGYLGRELIIEAEVKSNVPLNYVRLNYRKTGSTTFTVLDMTRLTGTWLWKARIPDSSVTLDGIDYYLTAQDSNGVTASSPADLVATPWYTITITDITPKMKVIIPDKGISLNEKFFTDIRLENVTDCYGATFELSFPPDILKVQDSDANRPGVQIKVGVFMGAGFNEVNDVDEKAGKIRFSVKGLSKPATGDGVLATIEFKNSSTVAGTRDVILSACLVEDKSHAIVTPATFNGKVILGGGSSDLVGAAGGTITGPDGTKLVVPAGAFNYAVRISMSKLTGRDSFPDISSLESSGSIQPVFVGMDIQPDTAEMLRTLDLVYVYTKDELDAVGIDSTMEKFLTLYRYDEEQLAWVKAGGQVSTGSNTVTSKLTRFGKFILVLDLSSPSLFYVRNLKASPNPFSPNGNGVKDETIIRYEMSGDAKVYLRIFNVRGEEVRRLVDGEDVIQGVDTRAWDGKDDFGDILATGIYIINVKAEDDFKRIGQESATVVISKNLFE
jgi:hypothetical protein